VKHTLLQLTLMGVLGIGGMLWLAVQAEDGCNGHGEILRRAEVLKRKDDEMKECVKRYGEKYCKN
jgi:hypothetical protein